MLTAKAKPSAARVCAGSAFSPKAGRTVKAGVTRAQASAQPRRSTFSALSIGCRICARSVWGGETGSNVESRVQGLRLTERKHRDNGVAQTAHEPRPFHDRFQDRTTRLHLRLEGRGSLRPRHRRKTRRAGLLV